MRLKEGKKEIRIRNKDEQKVKKRNTKKSEDRK